MYYHLIMEDGLKYKDLSIEEFEKIIENRKINFNSREKKWLAKQ